MIEDEALVGMMIEDFLGGFGYSVVRADKKFEICDFSRGHKTNRCCGRRHQYLWTSSGRRGHKLIEREIPFLFVSGYEKMRGSRYASIPFLRKPFTPEDLHDAVERVLRR